MMTSSERFTACMTFGDCDRIPLWEWGYWPSTLRRWRREALGEGVSPPQYAQCDAVENCGVDMWMLPRYRQEVLREDDRYVVRRTDRGVIERVPRSADTMSMPEHMEFPVKSREDWEALKARFDPADARRFPSDWQQRCAAWRAAGTMLKLQGPRSPSLFGFVRELLGPERTLYAFYDEPDLVHDMMETNTQFLVELLPKVLASAPIAAVYFWEDMCYNHGPLISPELFREFMLPRYRRITETAGRHGVELALVDSDGNVNELIPLWLEAGIRGVYPMEVAAGMDVAALRREYGRDLLMTGGFDKRALARDRQAIDAELARVMPVAEQGGYIPHLDHSIPHDVPYANFAYYFERKKAMLGA